MNKLFFSLMIIIIGCDSKPNTREIFNSLNIPSKNTYLDNRIIDMRYNKDQNGLCYASVTSIQSLSNIPYTYIPCNVLIEKGLYPE